MEHPEEKAAWQEEVQKEAELKARPSRARYDRARAALERRWRRRELKSDRMMKEIVDELWRHFADAPYCWCGFYLPGPKADELVLGPHRDTGPGGPSATPPKEGSGGVSKPARSPLPLRGVCGKVFETGAPVIVPDVKALGDSYVGGVPQALSEIALPVFDWKGKVWAVFDAGSSAPAAFDEMDQRWLERILNNFREVDRPQ